MVIDIERLLPGKSSRRSFVVSPYYKQAEVLTVIDTVQYPLS
jgi:hypothetical protein